MISCEPCGDCARCRASRRARRDLALLRVEVRRLRHLVQDAGDAIRDELDAAGWDEAAQHPTLRSKSRLLTRLERALRRGEG